MNYAWLFIGFLLGGVAVFCFLACAIAAFQRYVIDAFFKSPKE